MSNPHPNEENPEDHIGEPVPDPWTLPEPAPSAGSAPQGGEAEAPDGLVSG